MYTILELIHKCKKHKAYIDPFNLAEELNLPFSSYMKEESNNVQIEIRYKSIY